MAEHESAPILSRYPEIDFKHLEVTPPAVLYIDRDDRLYVRSWSAFALLQPTLGIRIRGEILQPDGRIRPWEYRHVPLSGGVPSLEVFTLSEGFLLSCSVQSEYANSSRGGLLVDVGILRGRGVAGQEMKLLIGGYPEINRVLSYPPTFYEASGSGVGSIGIQITSDPGAGAEISHTIPINEMWRVSTFRAVLVTDATVINRFPRLAITRAGVVSFLSQPHDAQAASTTRTYQWVLGGHFAAAPANNEYAGVLPEGYLGGGDVMSTSTVNLQAGDNWTFAIRLIEVWMRQQLT